MRAGVGRRALHETKTVPRETFLGGKCVAVFRTLTNVSQWLFFFNDSATTEIYTLSLHDALPIPPMPRRSADSTSRWRRRSRGAWAARLASRSEEHTSELQSRRDLVCRLLLETKKKQHFSIELSLQIKNKLKN